MDKELSELLKEGIKQIDPRLDNDLTLSVLERLFNEIMLFNSAFKLVSCDGKELVTKHILDCMAPIEIIRKRCQSVKTFADLGSGSGLPGIVLASALENIDFSLIERMGRRAGFLRNTVTLAGLGKQVKIIQSDLSEVSQQYDAISFRAFRHMKDIAGDLLRITRKGSVIFAYKSSEDDIAREISDLQNECPDVFSSEVIPYSVPFLEAKRNMLVLTRYA